MGDIANQIINGECCDTCCIPFDDIKGYMFTCANCTRSAVKKTKSKKMSCPLCKKKVTPIGMLTHIEMIHPKRLEASLKALISSLNNDKVAS